MENTQQIDDEFNPIVETYQQFLERKKDEEMHQSATRRAINALIGAAWFCLILALVSVMAGNYATAVLNLIMSLISVKASNTNLASIGRS